MTKSHTDKTDQNQTGLDRRAFLRGAGTGAGIAAGAAAIVVTGSSASPAQAETAAPTDTAGYRETAHIRRVYDLAKF